MLTLPSLYKLSLLSVLGVLHVFQLVFSSARNNCVCPLNDWGLLPGNAVYFGAVDSRWRFCLAAPSPSVFLVMFVCVHINPVWPVLLNVFLGAHLDILNDHVLGENDFLEAAAPSFGARQYLSHVSYSANSSLFIKTCSDLCPPPPAINSLSFSRSWTLKRRKGSL